MRPAARPSNLRATPRCGPPALSWRAARHVVGASPMALASVACKEEEQDGACAVAFAPKQEHGVRQLQPGADLHEAVCASFDSMVKAMHPCEYLKQKWATARDGHAKVALLH
eukprot:15454941-Alexandrium_andersonii.AAC.1